MSFRSLALVALLSAGTALSTGCASADSSSSVQGTDDDGSDDSNLTGNARQAQLNGLRARVQKDFAAAPSLKGYKLVFKVNVLNADSSKAFIRARILKRDAAGKDTELTDQNLKESVYKQDIEEGVFDGPEVIAGLKKSGTGWVIMKSGTEEAYMVGPTDVGWTGWDTTFGFTKKQLGFTN